jgi:hypothetical protein
MALPGVLGTVSQAQMRALKRSRGLVPEYYEDENGEVEIRVLASLPSGPHAPNKKEAQALRRICARTGLTPTEVRQRKNYRVELAEAAKGTLARTRDGLSRNWRRFAARIRGKTSAPPWSLEYQALFVAEWNQQRAIRLWSGPLDWRNLEGAQAYRWYAKLRGFVPVATQTAPAKPPQKA